MVNPWARREIWFLTLAILLGAIGAAWFYVSRATTLTIAVAPLGGTEPALLRAYADELAGLKRGLRLKIVSFDGVRESAEALQAGQVDLAVVRPDVMMPRNGMTLAVLREQAIFVATPATSGIKTFPDLAAKRLGVLARRTADRALVQAVLDHNGLRSSTETGAAPRGMVALVPLEEDDLAKAFSEGLIDAVVLVTTPTTPGAMRLVRSVQDAAENREVVLFGLPDVAAIVARLPKLQPVTVPSGLFGGQPRLPDDDLPTVGPSYRLMARSSLSRSVAAEVTQHLFEMRAGLAEKVAAAEGITHPAYDTTVTATSTRMPIHPGALDYYEREQESFIERYESWIYLVAIFGGGIGSVYAWLRQRLSRIRRHRIEVATESLLELRGKARRATELDRLQAMAAEIDDLAANIARNALNRPTKPRTLMAATVAIDAARSTVRRAIDGYR